MPMPAVGAVAPDFTLPSTSGSSVTLSQLRGRNVLLAFFPLAFTRVCTTEMCAFTEDLDRFQAVDTVVLPISVDSVPTLVEYKAKERIGVELLSDFKREVCRLYGTLDEEKFSSNRAYVVIDRQGTVRWVHLETATRHRRENAELLAELARLG